ncbi:MAG: bifunctional nicotinamidase/pyrazinamidase [Deltaproteobacteria bacterium]|nr:bifunctional nicotinamidase/pyrazinamidase [Deltaproteobacteria bacterium]
MKALLLVDLQNDFLPGGALAVPRGDEVVAVANALLSRFDVAVATQDWHPAEHGSFAPNHPGRSPGEVIDLDGTSQVLWPAHCIADTHGADFAAELQLQRVQGVVKKGTDAAVDSYSGFFDNGQRHATGLESYLRGRGVTHLFVMGLATDYCVKFTALDARRLGFEVSLVSDGCRAVDLRPGDGERALEELRSAGVHIVHSSAVATDDRQTLVEGKHLRLVRSSNGWEHVERTNCTGIVLVVALTENDRMLFVEQFRPPVGARVIELPAGIAGDHVTHRHEALESAAQRELVEETGYRAESLVMLTAGPPSAGLSTEVVAVYGATNLRRVAPGGGDASESIVVHEVPLAEVHGWLLTQQRRGLLVDTKVYAGLYFAHRLATEATL